jgi:plastocyanin
VKPTRPRARSARIAILAGLAALVALSALASVASAATVYMKADKKGLRFEAPKTVVNGETLDVVNQSNPKKVGPHTFSLVTKASLPKTPKAHQLCFTPKHICKAIAAWHGVKGNGPVKVNPVDVGPEGWSTMGSVTAKGDSWFTGEKAGTSFELPVNVDTSAGASRIYFICAIHSGMQGSINVLPGG